MITYNTESLVAAVKRKTQLPNSGNPMFSDQDIIDFANEELSSGVVPQLLSVRENYFAAPELIPLVSGQASYQIPDRAIGMQLIDIWYYGNNGTNNALAYIEYANSPFMIYQNATTNIPQAYTVVGNNYTLFPQLAAVDGNLVVTYSASPGLLVPSTACAQIVSIDTTTKVIGTSVTPASLGITAGTRIDLIRGRSGFNLLMINELVANTGANSVTLTNTVPPLLQVGDWVAITNQSPYPQIPAELHPILLQRTVVKLLEAMADPRLETSQGKLQEIEQKAYTMLSDRVKDKSYKLINLVSPMRRQSWRWL